MSKPVNAPVCVGCRRRAVDAAWRPFCSERCKIQDLARWADGAYAIPGETVVDRDEDADEGTEKSSDAYD